MADTSILGPIYCHKESDVPKQKHWAILTTDSVQETGYDPGDKPSTKHFIGYTAYLDKAAWEAEITARTEKRLFPREFDTHRPFLAIEVNPAEVNVSFSIKIG